MVWRIINRLRHRDYLLKQFQGPPKIKINRESNQMKSSNLIKTPRLSQQMNSKRAQVSKLERTTTTPIFISKTVILDFRRADQLVPWMILTRNLKKGIKYYMLKLNSWKITQIIGKQVTIKAHQEQDHLGQANLS